MCWQQAFLRRLGPAIAIAEIFDHVHNAVFSIKDREGRYALISLSSVDRCGLSSKEAAIGKTAFDLFPPRMAERYALQDKRLYESGLPIFDSLDLTLYPDGSSNWCVTTKQPLADDDGRLVGLACLSMDIGSPGQPSLVDAGFAEAIDYIHAHFAESLRIEALARIAGLTPAKFDRRMKRLFQLSPQQYLLKTRIDAAVRLLSSGRQPIAEIAQMTGFCDQSAFARQFKVAVGMTPREYRRMEKTARHRENEAWWQHADGVWRLHSS